MQIKSTQFFNTIQLQNTIFEFDVHIYHFVHFGFLIEKLSTHLHFDLFKLQQINGIVLNKRQASAFN
jgi:hypothetical protein